MSKWFYFITYKMYNNYFNQTNSRFMTIEKNVSLQKIANEHRRIAGVLPIVKEYNGGYAF